MRNSLTRLSLFFAVAFSTCAHVNAADASMTTVGEMLDMEAAAALAAEQERLHPQQTSAVIVPALQPNSAIPVLDTEAEPRLAAIYGVGERLRADVIIDSVRYTYAHGEAAPIAPRKSARTASHRLVRIEGSCVVLRPTTTGGSTRYCVE